MSTIQNKKDLIVPTILETGIILNVQDNILISTGLTRSFVGEVVLISTSYSTDECEGLIMNLELDVVKIVIIRGLQRNVKPGDRVTRTGHGAKTIGGFGTLGRIVSPLGNIIRSEGQSEELLFLDTLFSIFYIDIFTKAPGVSDRDSIYIPFITGIVAIDCFIPIGLGQRELLIGDLNTGKTSLALTMVINQRFFINVIDKSWRLLEGVLHSLRRTVRFTPCIYVLVGKRRSELIRIRNVLSKHYALHYTCILYAGCDQMASNVYLAPYAGIAMGEWFLHRGYHAIVILDDLSEHAVAYRQISLLLRRPPGREAYPGDIFFLHSKLLERATFSKRITGGGSVTCIPIIETKMGDISAYIPTNVISITDGQIFLSRAMLNKGIRPAIHLTLSVSRVGSKAQYNCMKEMAKHIKRDFAMFKMFESMSKVTSDLDAKSLAYVNRGHILTKFLNQKLYHSYTFFSEIISLYCIHHGLVDRVDLRFVHIYFLILLRGHFSKLYLEERPDLQKYFDTKHTYFMESVLIHSTVNMFKHDFKKISSLYTHFFLDVIQPRLFNDTKKVYIRALNSMAI